MGGVCCTCKPCLQVVQVYSASTQVDMGKPSVVSTIPLSSSLASPASFCSVSNPEEPCS